MARDTLEKAKVVKDDEFYTRLPDIEKELANYWQQLKGKSVYLNCDNPRNSSFWRYFYDNYSDIGISKLTATFYGEDAEIWIYDGSTLIVEPLKGNGSYDSEECIDVLSRCDVVVTNPPFSLFKNFIDVMTESGKDFLIIGNFLATGYGNIFDRIMNSDIKIGFNSGNANFDRPDGSEKAVKIAWFTTLDVDNQKPFIPLTKSFNSDDYPTYDNYDAIEVSKVKDVPSDYHGLIGVPITYLLKHNPEQFTILGIAEAKDLYGLKTRNYKDMYQVIDGDIKHCTGGVNTCAGLVYRVFRHDGNAVLPFNPKGNKKAYIDKTDGREVMLQLAFHRVFIKRKMSA